ncbi:hypothetical protein FHX08_005424 [Rhizobium sp. BK529]|nr:hypothetical protein [Rhizobium sp. BK529]TCR98726.1 hypothetical protein EV281_108116 [Rhizobium sp. BK418]
MTDHKISMPHRHTVRYEEDDLILEYEVELSAHGIILYNRAPKVVSGDRISCPDRADIIAEWLRSKFSNVKVDTSLPR